MDVVLVVDVDVDADVVVKNAVDVVEIAMNKRICESKYLF
jgi:hypothetical protein